MNSKKNKNGCCGCIMSFIVIIFTISVAISYVIKPIYSVVSFTILVIIIVIKSVIEGFAIKKKEYEETQLMILQKRQQIEKICQKAHQKKLIEENARIRNAELREQDKRDNHEQYEELTKR